MSLPVYSYGRERIIKFIPNNRFLIKPIQNTRFLMEVFTKYDDKIVTKSKFKFVFMLTVSTFLPKIGLL